jgi:hypothetical protein
VSGIDIGQYVADAARETALGHDPLDFSPLKDYLDHWSPSSLSMLRRCPYQWQQRYIHGRKERPGEALVVGQGVHAALEQNFTQKIKSKQDLDIIDLLGWYDDEGWQKTVDEQQEKAGESVLWDDQRKGPEPAKARGRLMLNGYHVAVSPRVQPIGVEGKILVDFGLAVPVEGRYDILREASVIDIKTGKAVKRKPQESWRIQAAVYGEATGRPVEFHSVSPSNVVTPLESPALLLQPTVREREHMRISLRAVSAEACMYMSVFGPDEPWPTHGRFHDWACSYCGFRPTCPAWEEG